MGEDVQSHRPGQGVTIRLTQVVKNFGRAPNVVEAIRCVSAEILPGRITGLVGPDGAGKTTLIRLIAGLQKADSGHIAVGELDPIADGSALHEQLGYMPQRFGLYEDLSVLENLVLYADLRGVGADARDGVFKRLLEFTTLQKFVDRRAGKLSGGMKQKLGLACALLGEPKVLLLDEPSVGVDPISRRELWKMVRELAGSGMAIVWSTSYLDEAELCESVLLMNAGSLAYDGTPDRLAERMQGRTVQIRHIEGNRRLVLQRALRASEVIDGVIQGQSVRLVLREASKPPGLTQLDAGPSAELVEVKPRLEDAFIDILGGGPGGDSVLARLVRPQGSTEETGNQPVIRAIALTKAFGDFVACDHVEFSVTRGEIFGLLGPNGAGKSTIFKMMCGLLAPSSGRAQVMGLDLATSAGEARQKLGYMAQKFSLYGGLQVRQNLSFFSGVYGLRGEAQRAKIAQMVEVFELTPYLRTTPDALPLGFKQRLALACALMHAPDILFLDEPTSGVDPITRREFWTHINGLVESGVTVMVTTHFMDEAEYCDRIALVYRGKLIATGTPDALKQQAATGEHGDPTMEDAFIELIERDDRATALAEAA
jgi:ABC-2 type transport system ATP-binding protein